MIGTLISPELEQLVREHRWGELRDVLADLDAPDVAEVLAELPPDDTAAVYRILPRHLASECFSHMSSHHQEELLAKLNGEQVAQVIREMSPDDQARLLDEMPAEVTRRLIETVPAEDLRAARELLGYPPDSAGRFMTPQYVAISPDKSAAETLAYIRGLKKPIETLAVLFVVDQQGHLISQVRLAALVLAEPTTLVQNIEDIPLVSVPATMDREEVVHQFSKYDRSVLPVTDSSGQMLGIITVDDVLDVAEQEVTEDIHKIGGMEALDMPYLSTAFAPLLRKRGGWLSVLFLGEMLTATAMAFFEDEIAKAVVLAMFVPLIISSGGNSGSQAASLIIRALAVGELTLKDWWQVMRRELASGLVLGGWLGFIGFLRVVVWQSIGLVNYGPHYALVALTVWFSLVGVVMFGTLSGSMLPFVMRRLGFDPAASSAPFVATLVDVTGLVIYFTTAWLILHGTLL